MVQVRASNPQNQISVSSVSNSSVVSSANSASKHYAKESEGFAEQAKQSAEQAKQSADYIAEAVDIAANNIQEAKIDALTSIETLRDEAVNRMETEYSNSVSLAGELHETTIIAIQEDANTIKESTCTEIEEFADEVTEEARGYAEQAKLATEGITAYFRGNWTNWANVPTDVTKYPKDYAGATVPTINDYMILEDASDYNLGEQLDGSWRFRYTGTWEEEGLNGWVPEYRINATCSDIPLLFGIWSEETLDPSYHIVEDNVELSADRYPKVWETLIGILDGAITCTDIKVCTVDDVETITNSGTRDWEYIKGLQKIAYYYIVDRTNRTFKLPRCLPSSRVLGDDVVHVIYNYTDKGEYSVMNDGFYKETGLFAWLFRDSKTVTETKDEESVEVTYEYHRPTNWSGETDIETEIIDTNPYKLYVKTKEITYDTALELINNKFSFDVEYCELCNDLSDDGTPVYKPVHSYVGENSRETVKTTNSVSTKLTVYDGQYKANQASNDLLQLCMPSGVDKCLLVCNIDGYVVPPMVSEYTTNYRLYIKVA